MKKYLVYIQLFFSVLAHAQIDYSSQWEDFFSYNNVKDFIIADDALFALTDNAIFSYNTSTKSTKKFSSIQGLSGDTTAAIHYSKKFERIIIAYENGLIQVIDKDGNITTSPEIVDFNLTSSKSVNAIFEYSDKLYLATDFAVVVYDISKLEFSDTYFIGNNSSIVEINDIAIYQDNIYAATKNGMYIADANNPNLIDFNNWNLAHTGNFSKLAIFNNNLYTSVGGSLYNLNTTLTQVKNYPNTIVNLKSSTTSLTLSFSKIALALDPSLNLITEIIPTDDFDFTAQQAYEENGQIYLGTQRFGILATTINSQTTFEEIHPKGPLFNTPFSIDAYNNSLWIVYGGIDDFYSPLRVRKGYSRFNGESWFHQRYNTTDFPYQDLVYVTIDKKEENKAYISVIGQINDRSSSIAGGIMEVQNDEITNYYNHTNSAIERVQLSHPTYTTVRVNGTTIDQNGNLWMTNYNVDKKVKKLTPNGNWTSFDLANLQTTSAPGLNEIAIDKAGTAWVGTRRNGVYIVNENGNRTKALTTEPNKGNLPNLNTRTVAIDANNRIWIGTLTGLVVFNNALGVFNSETDNAEPIIILDDGTPEKLLGDQTINTIVVDGADNKWFGTDNAGVLYTNSNGQKTLAKFTTANSPLPSNKILKIRVDDTTGKVFFATDKGLVAYNSNVAPFGEELGEVYAYPNPVLKNNDFVTITGRNGTTLPKGTNVKILDISGNLVHETNVVEGQELQGGKVVWNKRNLAGTKVASGVYIVLLATEDGSSSSSTKIAIVN